MRDNNILSRHIKPAARKLGLPWINWRCLRTSHATWMVEAGANPKDVQGQMRHSRISTTMDIYAQFVPESQRRASRSDPGLGSWADFPWRFLFWNAFTLRAGSTSEIEIFHQPTQPPPNRLEPSL